VNARKPETTIAVAGVSCRQQIEHFTGRKTLHIAEVLAGRIAPGHVWKPKPVEPPIDVEPTEEATAHLQNTGAGATSSTS
jgi:hypothetical protein